MTEQTFVKLVASVLDNYICVIGEDHLVSAGDSIIIGVTPVAIEEYKELSVSELHTKIEDTIEKMYYNNTSYSDFLPVITYRGFVKVDIQNIGRGNRFLLTIIRVPMDGSMRSNSKLNNHVLINSKIMTATFFRIVTLLSLIEDVITSLVNMLDPNTPPDAVSNSTL